ncbi:uncharacterized protein PRCAT00002342001 [Priceomyces carsonii]|uniref:uncharacterized protein n=1 Tax=Priceomyces carsonii TaxID=28549 RepID=UPI002EDB6EF2|nr:unnamed protein product [Priceomyces carsonii]
MTGFVSLGFPGTHIVKPPKFLAPMPPSPFNCSYLSLFYEKTMSVAFPLTVATVYFTSVHYLNTVVRSRQLKKAGKTKDTLTEVELKKLPAAPLACTKTVLFKLFVMIHNLFLCLYSVWTLLGMCSSMRRTMKEISQILPSNGKVGTFFEAACDLQYGFFAKNSTFYRLQMYGWWFYVSKFYEVVDTIIILLKGKPSSLLQSYHHAGAMMCMWAGVRFQSPPIWIFVVFNSFIHSLMYLYFFLSSLKIRVPNSFKRTLTLMQITQFVAGGSLAVLHAFIWYTDISTNSSVNCLTTAEQALPLYINVAYLTPLTGLFAAFYIDSYLKRTARK